jgi:hypothetical protein
VPQMEGHHDSQVTGTNTQQDWGFQLCVIGVMVQSCSLSSLQTWLFKTLPCPPVISLVSPECRGVH